LPVYDLRTSSRKGRVILRLRSRQMAKSPSSSSRSNNAFKVSSNLQGRVDGLRRISRRSASQLRSSFIYAGGRTHAEAFRLIWRIRNFIVIEGFRNAEWDAQNEERVIQSSTAERDTASKQSLWSADIKHLGLAHCSAGNSTFLLIGVEGISLDNKGGFSVACERCCHASCLSLFTTTYQVGDHDLRRTLQAGWHLML
jgi:hypothetical protein